MRFGIIANRKRPQAETIIRDVIEWISSHNCDYLVCGEIADLSPDPAKVASRETLAQRCDMVISMGGDGTMLAAARDVGALGVPVLGVNVGSLGFLTQITAAEVQHRLQQVIEGKHRIEERMMLQASVAVGSRSHTFFALNDVVVDRGSVARLIQFDLYVNEEYISTYRSDGLVVSTPTGSTAYNSAVGGPILNPVMQAIVISPIAPQSLASRPLLFDGNDIIRVKLSALEHQCLVTVDGQVSVELSGNGEVEIRKAPHVTRLVVFPHNSFYEILRTKLHWAVLPRAEH